MIIYENGQREIFDEVVEEEIIEEKEPKVEEEEEKIIEEKEIIEEEEEKEEVVEDYSYDDAVTVSPSPATYAANYFMLATGFGTSYGGGVGLRMQFRVGGNVGFGFHMGGGYNVVEDSFGASAGLKFFPFRGFYLINTQFGIVGRERAFGSIEETILLGPSAMIGGDWNWGRSVGFGFNAAVGATYILNTEQTQNIRPAFDIGFVIRF